MNYRQQTILTTLIIGILLFPISVMAAITPGVFNSSETAYSDLKPFPKWTGTLQRFFNGKTSIQENCESSTKDKCQYEAWLKMIDGAKKLSRKKQLTTVNKFLNRYKYIVDPINWGVEDYWATPQEFLKKFGDCEDYSIAKYMSLRALGWDKQKMRIIVLQDMNLKIMHAVLMVEFQGKRLILDNQISLVVEDKRIRHYKPIFSLNEFGWWRHKSKSKVKSNVIRKIVKRKKVKVIRSKKIKN